MRRLTILPLLLGLAVVGLSTVGPAAVASARPASISVPKPGCDTGGSQVDCWESSSPDGTSVTWSLYIALPEPVSWTVVSGNSVLAGCNAGYGIAVSYSYVYDGETYASPNTNVLCRSGYQ